MACGTGKTITALHIAERQVGRGGSVLYLVPSISLVRQTMRTWAANRTMHHNYLTVCSDKTVGREDSSTTSLSGYVTTDVDVIRARFGEMVEKTDALHVIFSTYQSSDKVRDAFTGRQFDLTIFDEAHRTAGVVRTDKDTKFTLAHHDKNIRSKKRLYMTATPRIHDNLATTRAKEKDRVLYSMEDPKTFGKLFYRLKFSDAIELGKLTDYQVVAFEVTKEEMADIEAEHGDTGVPLNESTKLSSVYNAILSQDEGKTNNLLQRVIVFCNSITASSDFSIGRFASKRDKRAKSGSGEAKPTGNFMKIVEKVNRERGINVRVRTDHVDGTYDSTYREDMLNNLREDFDKNECRILSNAQCLSEGVDVPALDGVVFYEPRKSVIDVVQAVGRVMRKKDGKEHGYVIVPVVTTKDGDIDTATKSNKSYETQMQVLNALRNHDDRIDRFFNQMQLVREQRKASGESPNEPSIPPPLEKSFEALKPLILKRVGGLYFADYGKRLGEVAADIERKIRSRVEKPDDRSADYVDIINNLHANLVGTVGETVTRGDAMRALAQHVAIKPVFDELFPSFSNPVSRAFDTAVASLDFREETEPLKEYYEDMEYQIKNITDEAVRQAVIKKIYDNFFKGFDKKTATEHGIVYTPVEAVDYIIHSIQHVLKTEFGVGFDDASVKVLDPFAGTGVFIARLMQSGLLGPGIYDKYKKDLHMNELLLLAYYVATVNIETTYYMKKKRRVPYANACYVDTFTLDPKYLEKKRTGEYIEPDETKLDRAFKPVLDRVKMQRGKDITVIMGNPPWNVDKSTTHEKIEQRIKDTYGRYATTTLTRSLRNSYIKAIRYASDRIGDSGVIGFVLPASWLSGNTEAGLRAVLYQEFTDIWVFDMRGNQQGTKGDESRREGGKIFGGGSRQPTAMMILVKNPSRHRKCTIHYHDIGDCLSRERKLDTIKSLKSIKTTNWQPKTPNEDHDWLYQRDPHVKQDYYKKCMPMGIRKGAELEPSIFGKFSNGIKSNRDSWVYNTSYGDLVDNMKRTIKHCAKIDLDNPDTNPQFVHWGKTKSPLKAALKRMHPERPKFDEANIHMALYKPFTNQYLYFDDGVFVSFPYDIHKFFPGRNITAISYAIMPTQPNPTQPNPTQPYYAATRPTSRDSSYHTPTELTGRHKLTGIPVQEDMNVAILVPDKLAEFTAFISNLPPDLETIHHNQTFPYRRT